MRRCKVTDFPTKSTNEIISRHLASNLHIGMSRDLTTAYFNSFTWGYVFKTKWGTCEDRGAARQTEGRSPPSTHVLVVFRLNAPISSLDPKVVPFHREFSLDFRSTVYSP